jgi:acetolactate synthase-1/2/3 large subunit
MRVADYIVERLANEGISNIYLVTGRGSIYLSDALARRKDLNTISMHHEQSAGYAAVAEAAVTGRIGSCFLSTGCGSTNAVSAVLSAWQDEVPAIFVSGNNLLEETTRHTSGSLRTFGEQETDIISIVEPITKYAAMLENPTDIELMMDKAISTAYERRMGPVWLDIPLDLQSAQVNPAPRERQMHAPIRSRVDVVSVLGRLNSAERPVILIGQGANSPSIRDAVREFVSQVQVPVVYEAASVDVIPWSDPLHVGSVGAMGCSRAGSFALQNADFVLALGSTLRSTLTGEDPSSFCRAAEFVLVDSDRTQLRPNHPHVETHVDMAVADFLASVAGATTTGSRREWTAKCRHWKENLRSLPSRDTGDEMIDLHDLAEAIGGAMPHDAVLVTDSGLTELIVPTNTRFAPAQQCVHPFSQGAMGYALPAAIGAAFATGRPVVTAIGDGSVMMNLQELQVIRHHNINVKVIITNNEAYAVIRKRQKDLFRGRTIGTDVSNGVSCPDFSAVAVGFAIPYVRIDKRSSFVNELGVALSTPGPMVVEVFTDPNQEYVRTSRAMSSSGRSVIRPLEDQLPFLDRQLFAAEMIVPTHNAD